MYYNYDIHIYLGNRELISEKIRLIYFGGTSKNLFDDKEAVNESYIVNLVNKILTKAVGLNATDIHFEPYENEGRVRYRINGELVYIRSLKKEDYGRLVARLKLLSKLDIAETRLPQDGRLKLSIDGLEIDVRVSTIPNIFGEKIVFRILNKNSFNFNLDSIGLGIDNIKEIKNIIRQPYGMVLISGPAGSGKTTTIYTILEELNRVNKNIITIEDPVEYTVEGINQSQVNEKINYSFELGLKSILRQDPDIVMIGELREENVSKLALKAAIFGHLVFSTIHTNSSIATIFRLLSMDIENYLIATGLIAIISQRLVRNLCDKCKVKRIITREEKRILKIKEDIEIYEARGCKACIDGYSGRLPIVEIIKIDRDFKKLINETTNILDFEKLLKEKNISSLYDEARKLVEEGRISLEEFMKIELTL